jgi:catechol 2,3-dioxygenase-like lactoylglutathione lyase family enzyme
METQISRIVQDYESGQITRRQLLTRLGAMMVLLGGGAGARAAESAAGTTGSTFEATSLNHIALHVTDVARSRDFYVKHLGMKVSRDSGTSAFLTCGNNFVALFRGDRPGMDHYCYSVKNYDVAAAEEKLRMAGMEDIRRTSGRIYFSDPDRLTVQLAAEAHLPR